ncbi:MAG: PQQ-binding-like beta-propeller repeat protein, partial [bacterium]|nr:PQQ-binding-like beta-propeller repeat protein [bacterium]
AEFRDVDGTVLLAPSTAVHAEPIVSLSNDEARTALRTSGNLAYISSADGRMFALNPKTGDVVWEAPFGGVNSAALAGDLLYVTAGGVVYCVKAENGEQIWEQNLEIPGTSSPALYDKWLSVVATKGHIYFIDRIHGDVLYNYYVKGGSYSDPIMADNRLYLLSNAGRLYAFQYKSP